MSEAEELICTYFSSKHSENEQLLTQHEKKTHPRAEQLIGKNETSLPKMRTPGDHSRLEKEPKRG